MRGFLVFCTKFGSLPVLNLFQVTLVSGLCFSSCKLISILNRSDIVEDLSRDVYELASQIRPDRSVE